MDGLLANCQTCPFPFLQGAAAAALRGLGCALGWLG